MAYIDCESIADKILEDVKGGSLAVIRNYDDPSAISYVRQLCKIAARKEIEIIEEDYGSHWMPESVTRLIEQHNNSKVNGIMVVSPDPKHYECLTKIDPQKRVEGSDFDDNANRVSCTARACVHIADSFLGGLEGKNALVIGYGKAVGKPLAYLLMRSHANAVTTTHAYTPLKEILEQHIPRADVIFSAVGNPGIIRGNYEGKTFIDAGVSIVQGRLRGDINPDLVESNDLTPVPGGVGPVTTALLMKNVSLAKRGEF